MKIPSSFEIFGHKIRIEEVEELLTDEDCFGSWNINKNLIKLQTTSNINKTTQEATLCHEIVHCILEHIGEDKLSKNEKFVDLFGQALYQVLNTTKYD